MQITISFNSGERTVYVNDDSFLYQSLFGEDSITLRFSLNESVDFPIGSSITYEGATYRMYVPAVWTRRSSSIIDYTLIFEGAYAELRKYRLRNIQDGRLKFSMNATPEEFMKLLVGNLNQEGRSSGWRQTCALTDIDGRTLEFNHTTIADALSTIAEEFDTEYRVSVGNDGAKVIELGKVEFHKDDPMPLSYGKGNGFLPGTGRTNSSDDLPVEILYVQGGSRNIDRSRYGSADLLLPKGKTLTLDGKTYESSQDGFSIKKSGQIPRYGNEDSIDLTEIYPKRVGQVTAVELVDADKHFYDIMDNTIEDSLDYDKYLIDGEDMTIIFQSGMLAGREFKINKYTHTSDGVPARRFEITPEEFDGLVMPSGNYIPRVGDKYAVFGCSLPQSYIADDSTETGAEWEMFREAARYLSEHSDFKFTFTGELQEKWVKNNWNTIGDRIRVGSYIRFSDTEFVPDGVDIRITGVKRFLNKGYSPTVELSNNVSQGRVSTLLKEVPMQEVSIQESYDRSVRFTKRRWRDAIETIDMLESAFNDKFSEGIMPVSVRTMSMLVGDERLQFELFADSAFKTYANKPYLSATSVIANACYLRHYTLGIDSKSDASTIGTGAKPAGYYKEWHMSAFERRLDSLEDKGYYLYAKCEKSGSNGIFEISSTSYEMNGSGSHYYFMVGILSSVDEGERSYVNVFGYTEILPSQITTDRVAAADGKSFFDLRNSAFRLEDRLSFADRRLVLNGAFIQTGGGEEPMGGYCGTYDANRTYQKNDEVSYTANGETCTYRYVNSTAGKGHAPTDKNYWIVVASGKQGEPGTPGRPGAPGEPGAPGNPGNGISGTAISYGISGSPSAQPTVWYDSPSKITFVAGYYVWTRTVTSYTNGTSDTSYSVARQGDKGDKGDKAPASPYRGEYSSSKTYYGTPNRCDIVHYGDQYYIALPTANGTFNVIPTNTAYWIPFGASFENIATGFLFAQEAVIDNAVVRLLRTAEEGKRIVALDNLLAMYDAQNQMRLMISGDNLSTVQSETTVWLDAQTIMGYQTSSPDLDIMFSSTGIEITAGTAGTLVLPKINCSATLNNGGTNYAAVDARYVFGWMVDDVFIGETSTPLDLRATAGAATGGVSISSRRMAVGSGKHTVKVACKVDAWASSGSANITVSGNASCDSDQYVRVQYEARKTEIGANGFRVAFTSDSYAEMIADGTSSAFVFRAGNYGLRITSRGVEKTSNGGGIWNPV